MRRALAILALVAVAVVGAATTAPAQTASPSVRLVSQTAWVTDGGSFDLLLDIDGDSDDLALQVTVHSRLRSRSAFAQSLEGRTRGTTTQVRLPVASVPFDGDGNRHVVLALPEADAAAAAATLPNLRQGVYPVSIALRDGTGRIEDRFVTHLVRVPDEDGLTPLSVAWLQPISAPPALTPTDVLGDAEHAGIRRSLRSLAAVAGLDVTFQTTPEILQRLDDDDLALLRQALGDGSQLLSTSYVEVDPSALVAAGLGDDLTAQRELGGEILFATLGVRGDPRTWAADQLVTTSAVARLRELGMTRLVVPEATLEPLDEDLTAGTTLTRPFELSAGDDEVVRAAAIEEGLLEHFRFGDDQVLAAHHFLADLAVLFFDFPGTTRGVVVRPPLQWRPSATFLGTVLPAIADVPILRTATLEQHFNDIDPLEDDGDAVVRTPGPARTGSLPVAGLRAAHDAVERLTSLVGPGDELIDELRTRILTAESTRLRPADRRELLASVVSERSDIESRIRIPAPRTVRLTAREGTIPLTLVNDNPFPVTIDLLLASDKLEFTGSQFDNRARHVLRLDLETGTQTVPVPVRTRASGTFPVRASLLTPDGAVIRRGQFTITSSAFSGVGVVLSIGAGLFLLLWWASHWRTVRRDRRLVGAPK